MRFELKMVYLEFYRMKCDETLALNNNNNNQSF
jgi:hypothetical protein